MFYYAHSLPQEAQEKWQPLDRHLQEVGRRAGEFASAFGAYDWAYLAGLWHDLGKYSSEFQAYLHNVNGTEAHIESVPGRVDHSTAGAQHAVVQMRLLGHLLAYAIAGHHSGMLDGRSDRVCQEDRLKKSIFDWKTAPGEITNTDHPTLPSFLAKALSRKDGFSISFFIRMIFSCLADADFLDTEQFMDPDKAALRVPLPSDTLVRMEQALEEYVGRFSENGTPVNADRRKVREACLIASNRPPGFFSLTVPTGGGKTLSSLAFSLRHAIVHRLDRIVYVLPFTTIIEQNADEFRKVIQLVGDIPRERLVIEHHSNFDPEKETAFSRLACENWDAPLVVTTSVQFYESLFGNRTSVCRKLHNLSRAVIILDEAQTIPVDYLQPVLRVLNELTTNYGATVVLCTATQPAVHKRSDFPIGIKGVREIVSDPKELYRRLKRVNVKNLGSQSDDDLVARLKKENQVLCIVNTRRHARKLMESLGKENGNFHLSALMCPAHRAQALNMIRKTLADGRSCRVISTQLIEAGVDVDFPAVYRSMAGLDSIAQAAGRCNRNGRMPEMGRTYIFRSEHVDKERFLADTANCAAQVLDLHGASLLELETIEHYFKLYYWDQTDRWDAKNVLRSFNLTHEKNLPFLFDFASVARVFKIISENNRPVIIPWEKEGRELCTMLRILPGLNRDVARLAQRYAVQIPLKTWIGQLNISIEPVFEGSMGILISSQLHYSNAFGLHFDDPTGDTLFV
ncbi:MAG: CRISPR-associated helicase Cas3' [Candidatus Aminicenantes bacterium]|nr:CRISPR-associated helicase Cas3' [Candidatus Aminicenantes bacterium]